jgi:hypothetical protein
LAEPVAAEKGKCEAPGVLDLGCEAAKTVAGATKDAVTAPLRYAAGSAVDILTSWVADSAQWVLGKVIGFIDHTTSPGLDADWFSERYRFMIGLAALVLLPLLLFAALRAVVTQDVGQLLRSFFIYLPVAILATFVAVYLAQALLAITDSLSAAVAQGIAGDVSQIFDAVGTTLSRTVGTVSPSTPSFAVFFATLLLILGSFLVWLELLVRSAAVTVCVFFLPLVLAGLVWPASARWTKRLIEVLVAVILSKFVIVAVISLATAALSDPGGGGFGTVMGGSALMLMAAFSPFALLKLMPLVEGAAIGHLDGVGRKPVEFARPGGGGHQAVTTVRSRLDKERKRELALADRSGKGASAGAGVTAAVATARTARAAAAVPGKRLDRHTESARSEGNPSSVGEDSGKGQRPKASRIPRAPRKDKG